MNGNEKLNMREFCLLMKAKWPSFIFYTFNVDCDLLEDKTFDNISSEFLLKRVQELQLDGKI